MFAKNHIKYEKISCGIGVGKDWIEREIIKICYSLILARIGIIEIGL